MSTTQTFNVQLLHASKKVIRKKVSRNAVNSKRGNKHIRRLPLQNYGVLSKISLEHQVITADRMKRLFLGETKSENTLFGLIISAPGM